jgi:SAM-dependent methyltransferase
MKFKGDINMKYRESGMPSEELWDTFFCPTEILEKIEVNKNVRNLLDIGCGYGTFLLPASELVSGNVVGIDIDKDMIEICKNKKQENNISNVDLVCGDISMENTAKKLEKYKKEIDYITLFNILHCEEPIKLLSKVFDMLNAQGKIGVIHWKYEDTPRGPSIEIRPRPEMIIKWAEKVGFTLQKQIEIPPYHFGLIFKK